MKKLFVLLFPQDEYFGQDIRKPEKFNECIQKRYIDKGYEFCVVNYKGSTSNYIKIAPHKIIEADITFHESSPYFTKDFRYANFEQIADSLQANEYSKIVISGFHCYSCVQQLAEAVYSLNQKTGVDTDLTESFGACEYRKNWDVSKYDPNLNINYFLDTSILAPCALKAIRERSENPIWHISKKTLKRLDSEINHIEQEMGK